MRFIGTLEGVEVFDRAFIRLTQIISDFRSIWPNVATEFYAIEADQFGSEGEKGASGKWAPLSPAYKKWKDAHFPGEPLLQLTHTLVDSLTDPEALGAIYRLEADEMTVGSKVEYATAHQKTRPLISFTTEDKRRIQKSIQAGLVRFTRQAGFQVDERLAA